MSLIATEEQQILKQSAADFVSRRSPISRVRELRDASDPIGFSRELWKEMAELGWAGLLLPEEHGGAGFGHADMAIVMEELGRALAPEPMLSTVLLGANAVLLGGTDAVEAEVLPAVASGEMLLALAATERTSRFDTARVATRAERDGEGWKLSGEKWLVLDGMAADRLVVTARTSGAPGEREGVTLFLVATDAPGVARTPQSLVDTRKAAIVTLDGARVETSAVLGEVDRGLDVLDRVETRAIAGLTAEMLGSLEQAFQMTLEYLRTRKQFGVLIGTFQALQHRAATVYTEAELARSAVAALCESLDAGDEGKARERAHVAKARLSDAFLLSANEAVQMHGGIGMTDEHDIGFYLKRARTAEMTLGDAAWHRDRYARLRGY